jgi:hypothetical protein
MKHPTRRRRLVTSLLIACALFAALAATSCSSKKSEDPADTPSECNALVNDGPVVGFVVAGATAPSPAGGTIADGVYQLTAANIYAAPAGFTNDTQLSSVMQVKGTVAQQVGSIDGEESRYTTKLTVSGTMLTAVDTCPEPETASFGLTATPTEFRLYAVPPGTTMTLEQVYSKR